MTKRRIAKNRIASILMSRSRCVKCAALVCFLLFFSACDRMAAHRSLLPPRARGMQDHQHPYNQPRRIFTFVKTNRASRIMPPSRETNFWVLLGVAVLVMGCLPIPFSSEGSNAAVITATPTRALDASNAIISDVVMAADTTGTEKTPVNVTKRFPANQAEFHAVVTLSDAPDDTRVRVVWRVVDDGEPARANAELAEYELTAGGSRNLDFILKPNAGRMRPGRYRADIYLNGELTRSLSFSVAASP